MSATPSGPRPSVVTWGAGVGVVAGSLLVISAFDAISGLRSLDAVTPVNQWFPQFPRGSADFDHAVTFVRIWYIGVAAFATLAAVLSAYAGMGNVAARRVLAPVAAVALIGSTAVNLPFGILLAAMLGLLWSPPARAWYSGTEFKWPPEKAAESGPVTERFGDSRTRPQSVLAAVILTWIGSAVLAAAAVSIGVVVAANSDVLTSMRTWTVLADSGVGDSGQRVLVLVVTVVFAIWSLVAAVLGALTLQGNNVARLLLASMAAGASFLSLLVFPLGLIPLILASVIAALLLSPSATEWFNRRTKGR